MIIFLTPYIFKFNFYIFKFTDFGLGIDDTICSFTIFYTAKKDLIEDGKMKEPIKWTKIRRKYPVMHGYNVNIKNVD